MNKAELIHDVAQRCDMKKKDIAVFVDAFVDSMSDILAQDGKITISGFASFEVKQMPSRTGRNPKTGESIEIPSKAKVTCKFSKILKDEVSK